MMYPPPALLIYDTQGTPVYRVNLRDQRAYGVRWSTQVPGGCGTFSCRLPVPPRGPDLTPDYLGFGYDLRVMLGGRCLWRGRLGFPRWRKSPSEGAYVEVQAVGYGANLGDQYYASTATGTVATNSIVSTALTDLTQQLGTATITATGVTLNASATLKAMNAGTVVAWAGLFGDSSNKPQVFTCYPKDRADLVVTFAPRATNPTVDMYLTDFEEPEFGANDADYANQVLVIYNGGSSNTTASNATLQAAGRDGFKRTRLVVMPMLSNGSDAAQVANTVLAAASEARMQAVNLRSRAGLNGLRIINQYGQALMPWDLRAGDLVRLRDVSPQSGSIGSLAYNRAFMVGRTEWSEDEQQLTVVPEQFGDTVERVLAQAQIVMDGRTGMTLVA